MLLLIIICLFLIPYATWIYYLAIMNLINVNNKKPLKDFVKVLSIVTLCIGYLLDTICNILVLTILFLEIPKEALVTKRLSRLKYSNSKWRQALAKWLCSKLLDDFDPKGCHCK